jgi:hypothetical protein
MKYRGSIVFVTALVCFAAGSLVTADLRHVNQASAESNRVFQLMIYHTLPGKAPALESIFRDDSKLMARYGINVVGFWVPNENAAWNDTFVYLVAHPSRDDANKNWQALLADPLSQQYVEAAKPLIEKVGKVFRVDEVYMRATDFSAMR